MNVEIGHGSRNIGNAIRLALGFFDGVPYRVGHRVSTGGVANALVN
jgi:hypothetical protein